jgi:hypothetical protein
VIGLRSPSQKWLVDKKQGGRLRAYHPDQYLYPG